MLMTYFTEDELLSIILISFTWVTSIFLGVALSLYMRYTMVVQGIYKSFF